MVKVVVAPPVLSECTEENVHLLLLDIAKGLEGFQVSNFKDTHLGLVFSRRTSLGASNQDPFSASLAHCL